MASSLLLIDDDLFIRELYEEVLKSAGFTVETHSDGKAGLAAIEEGSHDAILLDVMMPQIDGIGILTMLFEKKLIEKKGPIILLTNLVNDPVLQQAKRLGAKAVYAKTDITPDQLVEIVNNLLKNTPDAS
ncbi:MAG: response regulator [Pseudomonadales bacterium]|nr:response regulator [Pseudomonadales bacterium]